MDVYGLIDARNIDLWNALNKEYEINIEAEKRTTYLVQINKRKATIYVPLDNPNSGSFTHELLHILKRSSSLVKDFFM